MMHQQYEDMIEALQRSDLAPDVIDDITDAIVIECELTAWRRRRGPPDPATADVLRQLLGRPPDTAAGTDEPPTLWRSSPVPPRPAPHVSDTDGAIDEADGTGHADRS